MKHFIVTLVVVGTFMVQSSQGQSKLEAGEKEPTLVMDNDALQQQGEFLPNAQSTIDDSENQLGAAELFRQRALKLLDEYLAGIPNESVRLRVKIEAMKSISSRVRELKNWEYAQNEEKAKANMETILAKYINEAGDLKTVKDVGVQWEKVENERPALTRAFAERTDEKIRKTKTEIAKQYINAVMIKDHKLVRPLIESGAFDSVLNGQEKRQLIYDAAMLFITEH